MGIDAIEVFYVKNPMIVPFITACGEEPDIYSVLVRMHAGAHSAWSETSPFFHLLYYFSDHQKFKGLDALKLLCHLLYLPFAAFHASSCFCISSRTE